MTESPMQRLALRFRDISPRTRVFLSIVVVVVVADQISKWHAVANLTLAMAPPPGQSEPLGFGERFSRFMWERHPRRSEPVAVFESFWHFRYAENPGSAFSFLSGQPAWFRTPFFLVVSVAAMIFILFYYRRTTPEQKWLRMALALVFGGAVGNFVDRMHLGYVIDFIDWHVFIDWRVPVIDWYIGERTWPTFNIADSAITVGIAVMVVEMWFQKDPDKKSDKA